MSERFDPYHRWLAIPPQDQPPDHYRLLGLQRFEDNADVIESAADQRMAHLRTFQTGKHGKLSQQLLNEVAAARACLLDAAEKAAYDKQLRGRPSTKSDKAEKPHAAKKLPVAEKLPVAKKLPTAPAAPAKSPEPVVTVDRGGPATGATTGRRRKRSNLVPIVAGVMAGGVLVLALVVWAVIQTINGTGDVAVQPEVPQPGMPPAAPSTPPDSAVAVPEPDSVAPPADGNETEPDGPTFVLPTEVPSSPTDLTERPSPDEPPLGDPNATEPTSPDPASETIAGEPARSAVPSQDEQKSVLRQLDEIYNLAALQTPAERIELAGELLRLAKKSQTPAEKFVVLRKAAELASDGGDADLMFEAIDVMAADFELDAFQVKQGMLTKFAAAAKDPQRIGSFVAASRKLIDHAAAADRLDLALEIATLAYRTCQHSAGREYRKETLDRRRQLERFVEEQQKIKSALAAVEADPDDGPANLLLGRVYCFSRGDWERGLPYLAKGSDASLKAAAEQDLKGPADPDGQIEMADTWYDLADSADPATKAALLLRAGTWYERAQPQLTSGLLKTKLSRRLEEIAKVEAPWADAVGLTSSPSERTVRSKTRGPFDPATAEVLATLPGHAGAVRSVSFSPDSAVLVSGSEDRTVKFWDVAKGKFRAALPPFRETQLAVAFSPKGSLLAVGNGDKTISLWDPSRRKLLGILSGPQSRVRDVAFSGDGTLLASGSDDKTVGLWQVTDGKLLRTMRTHEFAVTSVAVRPDGSLVAAGSQGDYMRVCDTASGEVYWQQWTGPVGCLSFSPDGSLLAAGAKNAVLLLDVAAKKVSRKLEDHTAEVVCVAFSPDGATLTSGSRDGTLKIWDVRSGELRRTLEGFSGVVTSVAFSPDGSVLALGESTGKVQMWWSPEPTPGLPSPPLPPPTGPLAGTEPTDEKTPGTQPPLIPPGDGPPRDVNVTRFDPVSAELLGTFPADSERAVSLAFSPDGKTLIAGYKKHGVKFWDPQTLRLRGMLPPPKGEIRRLALSRDGSLLAVATSERVIGLWNTATGQLRGQLVGHTDGIARLAISPDGSLLASGSADTTVRLWDTKTARLVQTLQGHTARVDGVDFGQGGSVLASVADDGMLKLWDVPSGKLRETLQYPGKPQAVSLAFSLDGSALATGHDTFLLLWDLAAGTSRRPKGGHTTGVGNVVFHPGGSLLASTSREVRFWDPETGALLRTIDTNRSATGAIAFSPDGSKVAFAGERLPLQIWGQKPN